MFLFTQPDSDEEMKYKVFTSNLPARNYCPIKLYETWYHLQESLNMPMEQVPLLMAIAMEKYMKVNL